MRLYNVEIIVESALPALCVTAMTKRRRINLPISIYGNSFSIALTYGETRAIIQLQHKFVNGANRMYNKLVVPLNRYNNFAGSVHSLDVFLG